jgi:alpha,alpha-trehalase
MAHRFVLALLLSVVVGPAVAQTKEALTLSTPAQLYGELFERVQLEAAYPDGKTFVDAAPKDTPSNILKRYRDQRNDPSFRLKDFLEQHFDVAPAPDTQFRTDQSRGVVDHIDRLWDVLTRKPGAEPLYSSRLSLPQRYVVPGGRFSEIYYWDSYFTMLGLQQSARHDLVTAMIDNFAFLIAQFGHVPNGNRTYYLSRSQPPFFAAMVELEAAHGGKAVYLHRLAALQREYAFWMDGADRLEPNQAHRRVVRLEGGELLNRYWDDRDTPREESFREDVATAKSSGRPANEVYRDLRAAAESGWDFSSRWLKDGKHLATIHTTDFVPIDLNSLLYQLERTIEKACAIAEDRGCVDRMSEKAEQRKAAIHRYLWNESAGAFTDYDWRAKTQSSEVTAATMAPLYFKVAEPAQARTVAITVREHLLAPHGVVATTRDTGQQWDAPNGWAPLQWVAIGGLKNYQQDTLAATIAQRWVGKNLEVFRSSGKLVEKYDVVREGAGGGGEYPVQDGFGWTNGVLRKLLGMYPKLANE